MSAFIRPDRAETPPQPLTPTLTADGDLTAAAATAAAATAAAPTQAFLAVICLSGRTPPTADRPAIAIAQQEAEPESHGDFRCSPRPRRRSRQEAHRL